MSNNKTLLSSAISGWLNCHKISRHKAGHRLSGIFRKQAAIGGRVELRQLMYLQVQKNRGKSNAEEHLPTFSTNERRCVTAPFERVHSVGEFFGPAVIAVPRFLHGVRAPSL